MPTLNAIVVEDERLPRLALLQKLEDLRPQVEVVASCATYEEALQNILRLKPDILFLDIQLQGRDTIQLLEEVRQSMPLPYVIFTTAYADRRYLMSAIKLAAVDYLLKPIDKNELALAVAKVVQHEEERSLPTDGRLVFRTFNGKLFLTPDDIAFIRADGNYALLTTFEGEENVQQSLASLERQLDRALFVRADRSTIVNAKRIYKLNTRRRLCVFKSVDGSLVEVELTKTGIETLQRLL